MRCSTLLIYPLTALASLPLHRRQAAEVLGTAKPEPIEAFKYQDLDSTFPRHGAKRAKVWYGPFNLRAANATHGTQGGNLKSMDPAGTAWTKLATDFPTDITLLRARSRPVYADGARARAQNGVYTHHVGYVDVAKPLPEVARCRNRDAATPGRLSLFIGNPEDESEAVFTTPGEGGLVTGYYVGKGNPIVLTVDLVNYRDEAVAVYLEAEFDYVDGKSVGQADTSVQTWRLAECQKGDEYLAVDLPEGLNKFTLKSQEMIVLQDGYFFYGNGGINIVAKLNGEEICSSNAVYGTDDAIQKENGESWVTIRNMTTCNDHAVQFKKGDTVVLEANYDFDAHPRRQQHHGAMSELMGTFSYVWATEVAG